MLEHYRALTMLYDSLTQSTCSGLCSSPSDWE